jgi:hypothetical protein
MRFSILAVMAFPGFAGTLSYTGVFTNDNDVQLLSFSVLTDTTVTLRTFGYGGGTNAAGTPIAPGGFESVLQIFDAVTGDASSGPILPGIAPNCAPLNPVPANLGFCRDAYGQVFLAAGDYQVALTQYDNLANSTNLSGGFTYDADPNFASGFVGTFGFQGDGHWALDITTPDSTGVPEPASALLTIPVLLLAGLSLRKRAR